MAVTNKSISFRYRPNQPLRKVNGLLKATVQTYHHAKNKEEKRDVEKLIYNSKSSFKIIAKATVEEIF